MQTLLGFPRRTCASVGPQGALVAGLTNGFIANLLNSGQIMALETLQELLRAEEERKYTDEEERKPQKVR